MSNFYKNLHGDFQTHIKKTKTYLWAQIIYDSCNKTITVMYFFFRIIKVTYWNQPKKFYSITLANMHPLTLPSSNYKKKNQMKLKLKLVQKWFRFRLKKTARIIYKMSNMNLCIFRADIIYIKVILGAYWAEEMPLYKTSIIILSSPPYYQIHPRIKKEEEVNG